jgi:hypothetical protein
LDSIFASAARSILVVEDDVQLREAVTRTLTQAGCWEVGTTLSFFWPDRPVAYASGISAPQPRPQNLNAARIKPAGSSVYLS